MIGGPFAYGDHRGLQLTSYMIKFSHNIEKRTGGGGGLLKRLKEEVRFRTISWCELSRGVSWSCLNNMLSIVYIIYTIKEYWNAIEMLLSINHFLLIIRAISEFQISLHLLMSIEMSEKIHSLVLSWSWSDAVTVAANSNRQKNLFSSC